MSEMSTLSDDNFIKPDLPTRIEKNIPLTEPNKATFYVPGDRENAAIGYIDYPFADQDGSGAPARL